MGLAVKPVQNRHQAVTLAVLNSLHGQASRAKDCHRWGLAMFPNTAPKSLRSWHRRLVLAQLNGWAYPELDPSYPGRHWVLTPEGEAAYKDAILFWPGGA
jgi:hypothetical protein